MHHIHNVSLAIVALFSAVLAPACAEGPVDSDGAADEAVTDEEVAEAEQAASPPGYTLGASYELKSLPGGWEPSTVPTCQQFTNGVVRSWQLKEKNAKDFRYSKEWCRPMSRDGTLGSDNDFTEHFYYEGAGTVGMSSVPLDKLPVGVRVEVDTVWTAWLGNVPKVGDVAMLHDSAADILDKKTSYSQATPALGRDYTTYTVVCSPGYVMTGIGVYDTTPSSNASEIYGVKIKCRELLFE